MARTSFVGLFFSHCHFQSFCFSLNKSYYGYVISRHSLSIRSSQQKSAPGYEIETGIRTGNGNRTFLAVLQKIQILTD